MWIVLAALRRPITIIVAILGILGVAALAIARMPRDIFAPFAGIVTERAVHPGALVSASERTLLFQLVDASTIRATIDVPEAQAPRVRPGETDVQVAIRELGATIPGVVTRSASALDPRTRTLRVEADLRNADGALLPRMYGEATLVLERHRDALTVPVDAISRSGEGPGVVVIRDGHARRLRVRTGIDDGRSVEVVEGLDPGESVIASARGVSDGTAVRPRAPKKAAGPGP